MASVLEFPGTKIVCDCCGDIVSSENQENMLGCEICGEVACGFDGCAMWCPCEPTDDAYKHWLIAEAALEGYKLRYRPDLHPKSNGALTSASLAAIDFHNLSPK